MNNSKVTVTPKFCVLCAVYCGVLLISNVLAGKVIMPLGYTLPCAVILFPMVYVISDLMTEVYGLKNSKLAIITNTFMNLFMSLIFILATKIPSAPFMDSTAFDSVLANTPRLVFASLLSYFLGDMINSYSLSYFKAKLMNVPVLNCFMFRSIFSSCLGQIADTAGFITMAFYGTMPNEVLFQMIVAQYCVKIGYQIILHPFMHFICNWWKRIEGIDVVDNW